MAAKEEASVDQPGSPRALPSDVVLVGPNHSASLNGDSPRLKPESVAAIDVTGADLDISNSLPH